MTVFYTLLYIMGCGILAITLVPTTPMSKNQKEWITLLLFALGVFVAFSS